MPSRLRKLALTAHVVSSVGWLGAVIAFLAVAIAGLSSQDPATVRGAYLVMESTGWFVLVPLAGASLLTGVVESLTTRWGLVRHYWVVFKLVITLVATVVLLLYMQTLGELADLAQASEATDGDLGGLQSASPVLHAAGALVLLVTAAALAVFKPRGMTPYGWRRRAVR